MKVTVAVLIAAFLLIVFIVIHPGRHQTSPIADAASDKPSKLRSNELSVFETDLELGLEINKRLPTHLPRMLDGLVTTALKDEGIQQYKGELYHNCARIDREYRYIYLNTSALRENAEIQKLHDVWHQFILRIPRPDSNEIITREVTPCGEHFLESDPYDPVHAIKLDPDFRWTSEEWLKFYHNIRWVSLQNAYFAKRIFYCKIEPAQPGAAYRVIKFHHAKNIEDLRLAIRQRYSDLEQLMKQSREQPRSKKIQSRRTKRPVAKVTQPSETQPSRPETFQLPPPPPEINQN